MSFNRINIPIPVLDTMARIAEIDRAILAHLRKNGRMSCVELAKDIGLTGAVRPDPRISQERSQTADP